MIKYKGTFEIEKDYHKDHSYKIVQIALSKYFFEGIPVEDTIMSHRNIYDFCGASKMRKGSYSETRTLGYDKTGNPVVVKEKQQKVNRYYISNSKTTFYKIYTEGKSEGKEEVIDKGFHVTIFNRFEEKDWKDYKINYDYYVKEAYKIIDIIEPKQQLLFV